MSEPQGPITETDVHAYADGRLPEERAVAMAAWLAVHPEEAERIADYRRLGDELREAYRPVLDEPVPERLTRVARRGPQWRRLAAVAGWIALGAAIGAAGGWELRGTRSSSP